MNVKKSHITMIGHSYISIRFIKFCVAGGIGFLVDASILYLLLAYHIDPWMARIPSFVCANATTWYFNRIFTFQSQSHHLWHEWKKYFSSGVVAMLANYTGFIAILLFIPEVKFAPLIALMVGTLLGMLVNFELMKRYVFQ